MVFALADVEGRLLFSRADPERYGQDLRELGRVREVAGGERATWIWLDGDAQIGAARLAPAYPSPALYLVRGEPVVFGDEVHGVVLLGEPLDRELLESLRAISGVDLALVSRGRAIATTLSAAHEAELPRALERMSRPGNKPDGGIAELRLGRERFLALRAELDPGTPMADAGFLLLASLEAEMAAYRDLRATLLGVGLVVLAAALAVGFALARGITRPLLALGRAARQIGRGDLDARVAIATGDELETLGDAFNEMAAGLRERELIKSTLERYVSEARGRRAAARARPGRAGGRAPRAHGAVRRPRRLHDAGRGASARGGGRAAERVLRGGLRVGARRGRHREGLPGRRRGRVLGRADRAARPRACARAAPRWRRSSGSSACARAGSGRGAPAPGFRIGLHTAELVAGEIGSAERGAYGIVGDGMNLAARIESANKLYGTRVLLSEATRAALGPAFLLREIDLVRVVGRKQPVRLFELVAHEALGRRARAPHLRALRARARRVPRARLRRRAGRPRGAPGERPRRRPGARPAQPARGAGAEPAAARLGRRVRARDQVSERAPRHRAASQRAGSGTSAKASTSVDQSSLASCDTRTYSIQGRPSGARSMPVPPPEPP